MGKFNRVEFRGGDMDGVVFYEEFNGAKAISMFELSEGVSYTAMITEYKPSTILDGALILEAKIERIRESIH